MAEDTRDSFWDRRQIAELLAREAAYRERLAREHALSEKLRACSEALQRILHNRPPNEGNLIDTLHAIALLAGQTLEVERTSVWTADVAGENLCCRLLLVNGVEEPCEHLVLPFADSVRYREALSRDAPVAVGDALDDPRTLELRDYLLENRIGALLDISVVARSEPIGVVCLEHIGGPRTWRSAEIAFASHLGALVALGIEAERRVRAEYQAREVEARYRHLVESLPVVVYSMDPDRKRLRYLSPRVTDLSSFSAEEWMRMGAEGWMSRIVEEDRPRVLNRHGRGQLDGSSDELIYRVRLEDRGVRWIRDTSKLIRDAHGDPMAVQGILADITAQKEAELAREEGERRARTLIRNMAMVAVRIDAMGRVAEINPYFTKITGYEASEIVGRDWLDLVASREEAERLRRSFEAALRVGSISARAEFAIRTKSGKPRRLLWTRTVLKDLTARTNGLIILGMDLTDHLRLQAEVTQRAKVETLGQLASAVAHDFNNLLTVILNQSSLLSRMAKGERAQRAGASLDAALAQATELTHSLLVYSRKQPEQRVLTDVDELLHELGPLIRATASKQLRVSLDLRAESSRVWMDPTRLRQVVLNLVSCASQAAEGSGSSIRVSTHLEFVEQERAQPKRAEQGEYVVIKVEDDGQGMDPATTEKMFEPFFATEDAGRGMGLGLAICQSIVGEVGGFIGVESEPNQGTRISIYLPRKTAGAFVGRRAPLTSDVVRAPRVLLVFGEDLDRALATGAREAGYAVALAGNAKDALQRLTDAPHDVLVIDTKLTRERAALPRSAKALNPQLVAIAVVAHGQDRADEAAREDGYDLVIEAPLTGQELIAALDEALRMERAPRTSSA